jgi:hypothetical protein
VGQDAPNGYAALSKYEPGDEPVSVTADVENDQITAQIGGRKRAADLAETGKLVS